MTKRKICVVTGAIVNGGVEVLEESFFGSGAVSKEYIKVGGFIKDNSACKGDIS